MKAKQAQRAGSESDVSFEKDECIQYPKETAGKNGDVMTEVQSVGS